MVHQNSPTVEFGWEKIEGSLKRADTERSMDFRRANTEPSVDFRKANSKLSVHFRSPNTELIECKSELKSRERQGFPRAARTAPQDFPREIPRSSPFRPWKTLSFPSHYAFCWAKMQSLSDKIS